jgi:UDP-N-acetylmuramyl pentapeptide synthase
MRTIVAMAIGKLLRFLIRIVRPGGGSALPGTVARVIDPKLLERVIESAPLGLVVVSGSAGKSTTTKTLVLLLEAHGLRVFTNPSTANILQGYFAAVLQFANLRGQIQADVVVLEWDEGHWAALSKKLHPKLAVITNLLSDQLDRFLDPDLVLAKLNEIAVASEVLLANSDDPNLHLMLANHPKAESFGLSAELAVRIDRPSYALNFEDNLFVDQSCTVIQSDADTGILIAGTEIKFETKTPGLHQGLNIAGAVLAASKLLDLDMELTRKTLAAMPVVFARDEVAIIRERRVRLMLVQNYTSFQLNLDSLAFSPSPLMLMAGSDIHDPSWLWVVDFSKLTHVDVVGGFNAHELALRLKFAGVTFSEVIPEADKASEAFLSLPGDSPTILFSADAMRRTRRHLGLAR